MSALRLCACLLFAQWSAIWQTTVLAQGFNRRYDPIGIGEFQVSYAIEPNPQGYMIWGAGPVLLNDGFMYPILISMLLDEYGEVVAVDSVMVPPMTVYPGVWNTMSRRRAGGYVACGGTDSTEGPQQHFLLVKIQDDCTIDVVAQYGPDDEEWIGRQAIECKDGGFLMVGEMDGVGWIDGMLIKTDSSGVVEWERNYGGPLRDYFWSVDTTANEDVFVAGAFRAVEENVEWWVLRMDQNGDTIWSTIWGSDESDLIPIITTKRNGNVLFASGWRQQEDPWNSRVYMAEVDQSNGHRVWERMYGPVLDYTILRVAKEVAADEGHIAVGMAFAENSNFFQGLLLRTADNGDSLWMRRYFYYDSLMTDGVGELNDVIPTPDGGFIACGFTNWSYTGPTPPSYSQDIWVVKVDSLGCIVPGCDIPMGITSQATNMGYALVLYPNPVRDQLHAAIKLPVNFKAEGPLVLTVVSMAGELVRQETVPTSTPSDVMLDVMGLAAGAYTLHLSDGHTWIAGKKFVVE